MGIDEKDSCFKITTHLLEHGRKRIAFTGIGNWALGEMHKGYDAALTAGNITVNEQWKIDLHFDITGLERILELIRCDKIDAIVCQSDFIAGKIIAALHQNGIKVPQDVAVASAGSGKSFSEFTQVSLTTMLLPWRTLGEEAAHLLLSRIEKKEYPHPLPFKLQGEISCGASCGCREKKIKSLYTITPSESLKETIFAEEALHLE